jgi:homoserine O-acetyltransferase/O-succinyltransferase
LVVAATDPMRWSSIEPAGSMVEAPRLSWNCRRNLIMHGNVIRALWFSAALLAAAFTNLATAAETTLEPVQHEFVIRNFKTESGVELPEAHLVYGTYGRLNAARDNVVLLPSHYMAEMHGYEWLIGPGKALDPQQLFLVTSELFGNGRSSSPSNTPEPFRGPRFPVMTIRDNVAAVHQLLTQELQVSHLKAVIGFSMGAQQAFQWAVSHPDFMDRIVATAGTAKTYGHGVVRLESEIAALTTDPAFDGGNYQAQPEKGIQAFAIVWTAWLFSQEWWRRELWRTDASLGSNFAQVVERLKTNFIPGADANNLILQMRTWESNDVGNTPQFKGDVAAALRSIKAQVLYMPSATDLYFPVADARYEAAFIQRCRLVPIPDSVAVGTSSWRWRITGGCQVPQPADSTLPGRRNCEAKELKDAATRTMAFIARISESIARTTGCGPDGIGQACFAL